MGHLEVLPGGGHGEVLHHGAVGAALGAEVGGHRRRSAPAKCTATATAATTAEIIPVSRRSTRGHSTAVPGNTSIKIQRRLSGRQAIVHSNEWLCGNQDKFGTFCHHPCHPWTAPHGWGCCQTCSRHAPSQHPQHPCIDKACGMRSNAHCGALLTNATMYRQDISMASNI